MHTHSSSVIGNLIAIYGGMGMHTHSSSVIGNLIAIYGGMGMYTHSSSVIGNLVAVCWGVGIMCTRMARMVGVLPVSYVTSSSVLCVFVCGVDLFFCVCVCIFCCFFHLPCIRVFDFLSFYLVDSIYQDRDLLACFYGEQDMKISK